MLLPFELDPQIIHHIIYSQAGSIGKAIIELLMNSVDASATGVKLTIDRNGFNCADDGKGFATEEDVRMYFGRFGTPHEEGDATYGRFRLGRGQIMAHAKTTWSSNLWTMNVDTRSMGYSYDLDTLAAPEPGCSISGTWYEVLSDAEYMSTVQEIRDLVRYTPIEVELNGRVITRDPRKESWDFEDDYAYYRAKTEGAVSIYNLGVLVRHDPAHLWGAGGLIVTKQAIALNVSRTEILRKTCPIWKAVAKCFGKLADEVASRLGDHRKTEARREKSARALLSGDPAMQQLFSKEEVISILPGKRHLTMQDFLSRCRRGFDQAKYAVVENAFDVPKAESIARSRAAVLVHPQTIERFGCYNAADLHECIEQICSTLRDSYPDNCYYAQVHAPQMVDFGTMRDAFVERTSVVSEKTLDKETRRAWTALRWCLHGYAGLCTGGHIRYGNQVRGGKQFAIILGDSNKAEAWTDGETYIAIDKKIVQRLSGRALQTVAYVFNLVEHEIAHAGDSLDCGHDEAFYQRYHDISLRYSAERQRYMHLWLTKYTTSLETEGKRGSGAAAWRERELISRAGSGREKKGLPDLVDNAPDLPAMAKDLPQENSALLDRINDRLLQAGLIPPPPNWSEVISRAEAAQQALNEQQKEATAQREREEAAEAAEWAECEAEYEALMKEEREAELAAQSAAHGRLTALFGECPDGAWNYLYDIFGDAQAIANQTDDAIKAVFAEYQQYQADMAAGAYDDANVDDYSDEPTDTTPAAICDTYGRPLEAELLQLVRPDETQWSLERNAAAAGFMSIKSYLQWRSGE